MSERRSASAQSRPVAWSWPAPSSAMPVHTRKPRAARARRLRSIRTQDTSQVAQQPEGEDPEKKQPDRARAEDPGRLAGQGPRGFPAQVRQRNHGQRVELETGAQVAVQELVQRAQR